MMDSNSHFGLAPPCGVHALACFRRDQRSRSRPNTLKRGHQTPPAKQNENCCLMDTHSRQAGFSLVEVMCAILVLGVALVGLTHGVSLALTSNKESELQTNAALLAAGLLETLRAEGDLADGTTEGDWGETLPLYRWK